MTTHRLVLLTLLLSASVALYILEAIFFPPLPVPGAKLGLTNIVSLLLLKLTGFGDVLLNVVLRTVLGALVTGTVLSVSFYFSITAALTSFFAMWISMKVLGNKLSLVGISVIGATIHNLTQLWMAVMLLGHLGILAQAPLLLIIGLVTGIFNGILAQMLVERMRGMFDPVKF